MIEFGGVEISNVVLRWVQAFVVLAVAVEMFRAIRLLRNQRVMAIVYNAAMIVLSFFIVKILAAAVDGTFDSVGIASNLTNIGFWLFVYLKSRALRLQLQSEVLGEDGRRALSDRLDEILDEMDKTRREVRVEVSRVVKHTAAK